MNENFDDQPPKFNNPYKQPSPAPTLPPPVPQPVRVPVRFAVKQPIVTYLLLGMIFVIFLYSQNLPAGSLVPKDNPPDNVCTCEECRLAPQDSFVCAWAKVNQPIYDGEYYRLFTSMFLHANLMHIVFNGMALYIFGREVESTFGHVRFLIIYFLGGVTGSVGSLLYTQNISVGASGAIFAVFGALGVYFYHQRHLYGDNARRQLTQMVMIGAINIFLGVVIPNIDNAAHVGGLAGGIFLAWFIAPMFQLRPAEPSLNQPLMYIVEDTNTPNKWIIVPILFAGGIILSVGYAASVLG